MLKRLKVNRFRHVAPGCELGFDDGVNVVLGKNGTGKTTLLELIAMVVRVDMTPAQEEEFDLEFDLSYADHFAHIRFVHVEIPRPQPDPSLAELGQRLSNERRHTTSLSIEMGDTRLRVDDGTFTISHPGFGDLSLPGHTNLFQKNLLSELGSQILLSPKAPRHDYLKQCGVGLYRLNQRWSWRYDEALGTFDSMVGQSMGAKYAGPESPGISIHLNDDNTPRGTLFQAFPVVRYDTKESTVHGNSMVLNLTKDAEIGKFPKLAGYSDFSCRLSFGRIELDGDNRVLRLGPLEFQFNTGAAETLSHRELSYGEKRLLAFLYYLDLNHDGVVVADELVNGMHHDWIVECVESISGRQAFLTSQNPLLFNHIPITSAEQIARCFVRCTREEVGSRRLVRWSNLTDEQAYQFYREYEVGVEHVGEILRARGLW